MVIELWTEGALLASSFRDLELATDCALCLTCFVDRWSSMHDRST